jgi:class 3 adenylate cyclase/tetratricopeptide (TPR) repeat protein
MIAAPRREAILPITTILFTDLVGSTALMQRVGDERARESVDAHRKALAQAVAASGGTELQWLGDGLMAAFASPADAVRGAIAMQRATSGRAGAAELALRVGLDVGELLEQEQRGTGSGYFGTPIVIARRLCDLAAGGQILCSSTVAGLLRGRAAFRFQELGARTLKGIAEPELVHEIQYEREPAGGALPLPPLLGLSEKTKLVGRVQPLTRLRAALEAITRSGERRVCLIAGEPGIGKTRLAAELAFEAQRGGASVLFGRCDEEPLMPYQPFVEALRFAVAEAGAELLGSWAGRRGADLTRLVPELGERLPVGEPLRGDPQNDRARLFDAVVGFLENASRTRPLVLVLDDLHWADKPSLSLLMHLLRRPEPAPILVVGTYRETDLERQHPLAEVLADLRRVEGTERVLLRGLDAQETEALLQSVAPHDPSERTRGFAKAVHAETDGNPFFLHEVVRNFKEDGTITEQGGRWSSNVASLDEFEIPEGVREVIGRRLSRLGAECQTALARAAVQGRDFDLGVVERVAGIAGDAVLDALDEAIAAGLVEALPTPDRFRFAHALVRDTLYGELTTSRRIRVHRQVGEALEALGAAAKPERLGELALHYLEAAPGGDLAKAVQYGLAAAQHAQAASAHEEAIGHCERTLEAAGGDGAALAPAIRAELLTVLGESRLSSGQPEGAKAALDQVFALGDAVAPDIFARAALASAFFGDRSYGLRRDEEIERLAQAADRLDESSADLKVRTLLAIVGKLGSLTGEPEAARAWYERASAISGAAREPATLVRLKVQGIVLRWSADEFAAAAELAREAVRDAERAGDFELLQMARWFFALASLYVGDVRSAELSTERTFAEADQRMQPFGHAATAGLLASIAWGKGEIARFEEMNARARDLARRVPGEIAAVNLEMQLAWVRYFQGRLAEVASEIERRVGPVRDVPAWRPSWILLELARGHHEEARRVYSALVASRFDDLARDPTWALTRAQAAQCVVEMVDRDTALLAYETVRHLGQMNATVSGILSWGSISQQLGSLAALMDRFDDAERHFEDALAMNERMGERPALVRTRVDYAAMRLARGGPGDAARAAELARAAIAGAEPLGMKPSIERAQRILAEANSRA